MTEDQFGEPVAEHYDDAADPMFSAALIGPAVEVLVEPRDPPTAASRSHVSIRERP
jgi:hypothetical protein